MTSEISSNPADSAIPWKAPLTFPHSDLQLYSKRHWACWLCTERVPCSPAALCDLQLVCSTLANHPARSGRALIRTAEASGSKPSHHLSYLAVSLAVWKTVQMLFWVIMLLCIIPGWINVSGACMHVRLNLFALNKSLLKTCAALSPAAPPIQPCLSCSIVIYRALFAIRADRQGCSV